MTEDGTYRRASDEEPGYAPARRLHGLTERMESGYEPDEDDLERAVKDMQMTVEETKRLTSTLSRFFGAYLEELASRFEPMVEMLDDLDLDLETDLGDSE